MRQDTFKKDVKFVIARRFSSEAIASIYAARLEEAGINSFISNSNTGTLIPFISGGIIMHVAESDLAETKQIFTALDEKSNLKVDEDYHDADHDEIEYQRTLHEHESKVSRGDGKVLAVVLIVIILIIVAIGTIMQTRYANQKATGYLYEGLDLDRYSSNVASIDPLLPGY